MVIDIKRHYFHYYDGMSELSTLGKFRIGEIVTDWLGQTGCILTISKFGDIRTDSNGMGHISNIKKLRSKAKIEKYLHCLYKADIQFVTSTYKQEIDAIINK